MNLLGGVWNRIPASRAFAIRDFRLLWTGSLLSLIGVQAQNVAQGWLVYDLTGDRSKLALVSFCLMVPVSLFGPFVGVYADILDKRRVLVICMIVNAIAAALLGMAVMFGVVEYWHFLAVALVNGCVHTIEVPTRHAVVRQVVGAQTLPIAVPTQSMTFNLARVAGPPIGGLLYDLIGAQSCYFLNAISFSALIFGVMAIGADLRAKPGRLEPIAGLIREGMSYTLTHASLRTLFIMETITSIFGLFYMALMPSIAQDMLGLGTRGFGIAMGFIGGGALVGVGFLTVVSHKPIKPVLSRLSMTVFGLALFALSFVRTPAIAYPLLSVLGASVIMQFNITNTLFQLIAPERLRGRVLSMHMWAIMGAAPIGAILFGWIAEATSMPLALKIGAVAVLCGAGFAWLSHKHVEEPDMDTVE